MGRKVAYFGKNGTWIGQKSALWLLLVLALVFSEGCSRKVPCPDTTKATAKAKKQKKTKVVKTKMVPGEDGDYDSETAMETATDETAEASTEKKPNLSTSKNKYNKNGLLQKKKYKRLRSNPAKKSPRVKNGNFFSRLFSGGNKTKSRPSRKQNIDPFDE